MSHWAQIRSYGCFIYFDGDVPARGLIETLVSRFDLAGELKLSTRNYYLRWRKFSWKAVDAAIGSSDTLSISVLVGTPQDVRLGGAVTLRLEGKFPEFEEPPLFWIGAESGRWPEPVFTALARDFMRIAAKHGNPLSGGVLAASELRNAKVEMTRVFESFPGDESNASLAEFEKRLRGERPREQTYDKIRRVYPITLLGPKFASQVDASKLVEAGAKNVEHVNGSIIFDASEHLLEAWSPEYLAATVELRRLLWPLSFQNPADDPDPPRRRR